MLARSPAARPGDWGAEGRTAGSLESATAVGCVPVAGAVTRATLPRATCGYQHNTPRREHPASGEPSAGRGVTVLTRRAGRRRERAPGRCREEQAPRAAHPLLRAGDVPVERRLRRIPAARAVASPASRRPAAVAPRPSAVAPRSGQPPHRLSSPSHRPRARRSPRNARRVSRQAQRSASPDARARGVGLRLDLRMWSSWAAW